MLTNLLRYALITLLFMGTTNYGKNINPSKLLNQIINDTKNGSLSAEKEEFYAKQLRYLLLKSHPCPLTDEIQEKLLENIHHQFPSIPEKDYAISKSIGNVFLFHGYPWDLTVTTLLREGRLFCFNAEIHLSLVYETDGDNIFGVGDFKKYDPRILQFFKETSLEGHSDSQYHYGRFLLHGIGTQQNIREGLKYLESLSQKGDSMSSLELAFYYEKQEDLKNYEKYLRRASLQYSTKAHIYLALLELHKGNFVETLTLYNTLFELNPKDPGLKLILCFMHIKGWKTLNDPEKGFLLIKQASEEINYYYDLKTLEAIGYLYDLETGALIHCNLGICYKYGIGTEQSTEKAEECFNKCKGIHVSPINLLCETDQTKP